MEKKFYDFSAVSLDGKQIDMSSYKGKVVLVVNTASKCGYTKQYETLEQLYRKYKDKGLAVLGFPCNQFGGQEPGSSEEIAEFCSLNYGVSFDMFEKIKVNGDDAHPLYKYLKEALPGIGKAIKWNFTKFLIDADGTPVKRFASGDTPEDIEPHIVELLKKKGLNKLGKTGCEVFPIAFGGIVVMNAEPEDAAKYVEYAVKNRINYFDVAPSYGDAEIKLGPALEPFRKDVYLASKTHHRDAKSAKETLDESLKRLKTDYLDVYQLHAIKNVENDVDAVFKKGGAMEVLIEAKEAGIVKNLGFSAHSVEAAMAAMQRYDFDTIMYPVNFALHFEKQFEVEVLQEAKKREMGVLGIKSIAKSRWENAEQRQKTYSKCWYQPYDDGEIAEKAINFTLNCGADMAVSPGHFELLELMTKVFKGKRELEKSEIDMLKAEAKTSDLIF